MQAAMMVSQEELAAFTGLVRPKAQAQFLRARFPKIVFTFRADGTIALRQEEFDHYTLGNWIQKAAKRRWRQDLSVLEEVH